MKRSMITFILFITFYLVQNDLTAQEVKIFVTAQDSIIVTALRDNPISQYSSIATKLYIPIQQIPMSVGVVNNALINNQNSFILGDALRNISGVNTQTGFGVHDYFIIRGFNSLDNALILIDGTPEPEVTYYNLYNIDRVEVLKGSGSFLYGSNPLSGTVNLYRKQPIFSNFLNLHTTYGQFGTFRHALDAGFGSPEKKFASRINMLFENADNYRDDKANKVLAVNPSMTTYLGRLTVNLNLEFINSQYKPDTGLPLIFDLTTQKLNRLPNVPRTHSYQTPFDRSDQKIYRFKLGLHQKFNSFLTFQSQFYFTRLDWNSQGTLLNGTYPNLAGSMDVYRSLSYLEDDRDLFGNQNELVWSFHTGPLGHYLLTGLEWNILQEDYRYDNVPVLPPVDLYNPVETAVESELIMYPYLRGDVEDRVIAPYIVDQITLSDQI
ncbi:TonB-dependent receptor plug domain-containing protein, partial [bacterium]|nr:TonB-dependent receptor plug domain-containing protein [bacterium]